MSASQKVKRESDSPAHDFHRQNLHPPRSSLVSLNFTSNYLDEKHEKYFRFCREFGGKLFEKEKDDASATKREGKTGALRQCFKEKWGEVVPQEE